ncbi:RNA-binding protein 7-like [Argonauta hians]
MDGLEKSLYVRNLPENITEELLYELFLQAGPLEKVFLAKEKSYAFINFKHAESIPYTLQVLDGVSLYGRNLALRPRNSRSSNNPPEDYRMREPSRGNDPYRNEGNSPAGNYNQSYYDKRIVSHNAGYLNQKNLPNMMPADKKFYDNRSQRSNQMDYGRNHRASGFRNNNSYRHEPYRRY